MRSGWIWSFSLSLVLMTPALPSSPAKANQELPALLERYYSVENAAEDRAALAAQIEKASGGDAEAVAAHLRRLFVQAETPFLDRISVPGAGLDGLEVRCIRPRDGQPGTAAPLVLCLANRDRQAINVAFHTLHQPGPALYCSPDRVLPPGSGTTKAVEAIISTLRRHAHLDPDRTYLFGEGEAADHAWVLAIARPDLFAGVIVVSGYPPWPYAEQAYAFLLPNLSQSPVLTIWPKVDALHGIVTANNTGIGDQTARTRPQLVDAHNRAIAAYAERLQLPITSVPLPGQPAHPADIRVSSTASAEMLQTPRAAPSRRVSHWFRYPDQGRAGWLRLVEFRGEVWENEQIDILPASGVDRAAFVTQVLQDRLGYLGGTIENNVIDITTRRAARIEVLLTPDLVDFSRSVRVICNGIKRYDAPVSPSIALMLESAWETWDFKHPAWARLTFNIQADADR